MITGSVGKGGQNLRQDVMHVQQLLNKHIAKIMPLRPITADGLVGPKTIEAITEFQRRVVGMGLPDGRVDPKGKTLASLEAMVAGHLGPQQNLDLAKRAVNYVKQKVHIGAANKLSDIFLSKGESLGCVLGSRLSQKLIDIGFSEPEWAKGKLNIEVLALGTEKANCGNCGEQAAVAFVYLWKQLIAKPLDYMYLTNGDHAFVVIGRNSGLASNVSTWGPSAVVCDPWDNKSYAASEIGTQLNGGTFDSMLRID